MRKGVAVGIWVIAVIVFIAALLAFAWWRRRQKIAVTDALARRPQLPSSPYQVARGFKILRDGEEPTLDEPIEKPRIESTGELIFGDGVPSIESTPELHSVEQRVEEQWALERSMHRSLTSSVRGRRRTPLLVGSVVVLAVGIAAIWLLA